MVVKKPLNIINPIINKTNRDNTRYWVGYKNGDKVVYLNTKPVPKSMASQLIAAAYCNKMMANSNTPLTIGDLREAFKGEEIRPDNSYLKFLFYDKDKDFKYDKGSRSGQEIILTDSWDFYPDRKLPNVDSTGIRMVKKWNKDDFDRLRNKAKDYGIIVEPSS